MSRLFLDIKLMGQYFLLVNKDKQEYVCPWCLGGGAKLWEWAANSEIRIVALLLRQSNEGGGGDWYGYHQGYDEGECVECKQGKHGEDAKVVGSWAGDRVVLVGDYDKSDLFDEARNTYRNLSLDLARAFNQFIEIPEYRLKTELCGEQCRGRAAK